MFVALAGLAIGALVRYVLPHRSTHGALVLPAVGLCVAAVSYAALTWLGFTADGGWIWTISLGLCTLAAFGVGALLPRRRRTSDSALLDRLTKP